jgi:hypothetical protein
MVGLCVWILSVVLEVTMSITSFLEFMGKLCWNFGSGYISKDKQWKCKILLKSVDQLILSIDPDDRLMEWTIKITIV